MEDFITNIRDLAIEQQTIQGLMKDYCQPQTDNSGKLILGKTPEFQTKCNEWIVKNDELNNRASSWLKISGVLGITANQTSIISSTATSYAAHGQLFVDTIDIVMIIPFAFSAMFELVDRYRKGSDIASGFTVALTIGGFAAILIGFLVILAIIQCAYPSSPTFCPRI